MEAMKLEKKLEEKMTKVNNALKSYKKEAT